MFDVFQSKQLQCVVAHVSVSLHSIQLAGMLLSLLYHVQRY